mgnify:CR=1 FL=1
MSEWIQALSPFAGVGLAFALGLLIGVERGWSHRLEPDGSRVAGIRTFALLGLAGGVAGEATARISPLIGAAILIAAAAALLIGYARAAAKDELSATTTVVGIITLGLGALAAAGQWSLACVLAALTTLILAQRKRLHEWVEGLSELELQAIVRFALISLAILPLLPNREFGPMNAWNPREIWMVVVLVSGLSLIGYAASRKLGAEKGVLATAAVGAVVSSTAVTAAMAARIRKSDGETRVLVAGIALASTVMIARVLVIVAVLAPFALSSFALMAVPAGLVGAAYVAWALRLKSGAASDGPAPSVRNPFDLGPALLLAGLVMVITLAGRWAMQAFGGAGLAVVLGISGMVDVDAAIIAMSRLPAGSLTPRIAGLILAAPILANTLVKAGLAFAIAKGSTGVRAATPLLVTFLAGLAGVVALAVVF